MATTKFIDQVKQVIIAATLIVPAAEAGNLSSFYKDTVTYLGVTSSTYDGLGVGGRFAANAKCVADYGAGARIMTMHDLQRLGRTAAFASDGWFDCRDAMSSHYTGTVTQFSCGGVISSNNGTGNCGNWGSNTSVWSAFTISTAGAIVPVACNIAKAIHCVK